MQEESLKGNGVEVTTDPKDDYDVVHINTIFPSDYFMAKKAKKCGKKVVSVSYTHLTLPTTERV